LSSGDNEGAEYVRLDTNVLGQDDEAQASRPLNAREQKVVDKMWEDYHRRAQTFRDTIDREAQPLLPYIKRKIKPEEADSLISKMLVDAQERIIKREDMATDPKYFDSECVFLKENTNRSLSPRDSKLLLHRLTQKSPSPHRVKFLLNESTSPAKNLSKYAESIKQRHEEMIRKANEKREQDKKEAAKKNLFPPVIKIDVKAK